MSDDDGMRMMHQKAPFPKELEMLVERLHYRPGWTFALRHDLNRGQGSIGLTFDVMTRGVNSYNPDGPSNYGVHHYFPVPPAAYDKRSWRHWLFEQILLVERHEAMEFFRFEHDGDFVGRDGEHHDTYIDRPYRPNHGPGHDPYIVSELATDEQRRTSFTGITREDYR